MKKWALAAAVLLTLFAGGMPAGPTIRPPGAAAAGPSLPARLIVPGFINNPADLDIVWVKNLGKTRATMTVAYFNQDGSPLPAGSETQGIEQGAHGGFPIYGQATVPNPFRGLAVIYSDNPLAAVVRHWPTTARVPGAVSVARAYPVSTAQGATIALPYVANALDGTYNTLITIANTGTKVACVQVAYSFVPGAGAVGAGGRPVLNDAGPGGGGCASGYPVPVNGQITLGPAADAGITPMPGGTANALMSATITATNAPVAANVYAYLSGGSAKGEWYSGFFVDPPASGVRTDDLGTEISIPIALKTADGYYSQILVSNPNPAAANVTIDYAGGGTTRSVALTVPANGVANHSVYADDTVPVGFVGAATIHSTQPLAAVVFRSKMTTAGSYADEDLYTAMNGVPLVRGTRTVHLPWVVRRQAHDARHDGRNSWVSVAVVGGGSANLNFSTVATATDNPVCATNGTFATTRRITGSFVFYLNLDQDNGLGAAPDCLVGAMTITSDTPIIAVVDAITDLLTGDQEAGYNAIPGD